MEHQFCGLSRQEYYVINTITPYYRNAPLQEYTPNIIATPKHRLASRLLHAYISEEQPSSRRPLSTESNVVLVGLSKI